MCALNGQLKTRLAFSAEAIRSIIAHSLVTIVLDPMIEPTNLFDPVLYRSQRKPLPEALGLPGWCYTSETFYRKEVDEIFLKTWLFIGHAAEIPTSGEYLCIDTPGGPVIVIRDQNATVRAFANTCRHRGARLLEGSGRCERAIVCPYHGWTYAFDGTLKGAPAMDKTAGFEPAKYGLKPIKLSQWQDLMWINFDPHAASLETYLGSMISDYSDYHFSDMVVTRRARATVSVPAPCLCSRSSKMA